MSSRALGRRLEALVRDHDAAARVETDPVRFPRRYAAPADREIVGLLASSLAFGNVKAIGASIERALSAMGRVERGERAGRGRGGNAPVERPAALVERLAASRRDARALERALEGFVHRVYRGEDVARLMARAGALRVAHGGIGERLSAHLADAGELREALGRLADELRGPEPSRGMAHLVPDPRRGSACKRLLLYCRWMIRPDDGVDLGVWTLPASTLVIPVDTHIHRIGRNLGLTARADASWRTAEEITAALRRFDANDPVRFDFALCHLGVSRACPSRRVPETCDACALQRVCCVWTG